MKHTASSATNEDGPCNEEELNSTKLEKKDFRSKLLKLCKTRTKKSSPDLFNFYVLLAGHDMIIDAGRETRCRRKFKAPGLQTEDQKMKDFPKTWVSSNNRLKISDEKNAFLA